MHYNSSQRLKETNGFQGFQANHMLRFVDASPQKNNFLLTKVNGFIAKR